MQSILVENRSPEPKLIILLNLLKSSCPNWDPSYLVVSGHSQVPDIDGSCHASLSLKVHTSIKQILNHFKSSINAKNSHAEMLKTSRGDIGMEHQLLYPIRGRGHMLNNLKERVRMEHNLQEGRSQTPLPLLKSNSS